MLHIRLRLVQYWAVAGLLFSSPWPAFVQVRFIGRTNDRFKNAMDQVANQSIDRVRPHRDLPSFYQSPEKRAQFVSRLFDDTARYYDRISGALSFGTCKAYRKWALRRAGLQPGMSLLD